jgi:hypothetical protein
MRILAISGIINRVREALTLPPIEALAFRKSA